MIYSPKILKSLWQESPVAISCANNKQMFIRMPSVMTNSGTNQADQVHLTDHCIGKPNYLLHPYKTNHKTAEPSCLKIEFKTLFSCCSMFRWEHHKDWKKYTDWLTASFQNTQSYWGKWLLTARILLQLGGRCMLTMSLASIKSYPWSFTYLSLLGVTIFISPSKDRCGIVPDASEHVTIANR